MILEVFCCSGGMAEGLRREGLEPEMAFDKDPDACASYERNLRRRPVQMDARDLLRMVEAGWRPERPIDLFVADPPCTPWSRAGKRQGQADERDMLAVTVELVGLLRPRAWLIANVPGLDDGPNWPTVQRTIGGLSAPGRGGYCIDFVRLDAANYGVPQHRVRPFWFGHGQGTAHIAWPLPTHCDPKQLQNGHIAGTELAPWVTCRKALSHLSPADLGSPVRLRWRGSKGHQMASIPDRPARVVGTSGLSDGNVLAHPTEAFRKKKARHKQVPDHRPAGADEPAKALTRNTHSDGALLDLGEDEVVFEGDEEHPGQPVLILRERTDGSIRESEMDKPAHTLRGGRSSSERLMMNPRHPPNELDAPSSTIGAKGDRGGQGATVLVTSKHPVSGADEPAMVVSASDGGGSKHAMAWPWDRPGTTIQVDPRMAPAGHHGKSFLTDNNRGHGPNAVKLSETAAAILQGFPDGRCKCQREQWESAGTRQHAQMASTSTEGTSGSGTSLPITSNGSDITVPCQTGTTSTTKTKTRRTTALTTSSSSPTTSIRATTEAIDSTMAYSSRGAHDAEGSSRSRQSTGTPMVATSPATSHATSKRSLTESDVCEQCGEPTRSWVFHGETKRARWSQLGQAMPPPLAQAVARSIRKQMAQMAADDRNDPPMWTYGEGTFDQP